MKITRRKLAAAALVPAAAALAQNQPALPRSPDEERNAAHDRAKGLSDALARQSVPMATEPAFQFKA